MTSTARRLIQGAYFEPVDLKVLRDAFGQVWASIAPLYGKDAATLDAAQQELATIILDLAKDGQLHSRPPDARGLSPRSQST